ncbi:MAG: hypothetical protein ACXWXZ_04065 [Candidatus Binatia bacterium]
MALGTNYKRNIDRSDKAIQDRMNKAVELAKELNGDLALASRVVLGRISLEEAKRKS